MIKNRLRKIIHKRYRVSFSKSGEDLQVYKLLRGSKGMYLDIGCFEPITFSNTYFFYLRNWSGLVVDPNPRLKEMFQKVRPKDIFINKGISSSAGVLKYYQLPRKLSSMNTFNYEFLEKNGLVNQIENEIEIPLTTICQLSEEFDLSNKIDFMDVDVEGLDLEVLSSNNWERLRPKIVMVETDSSIETDIVGDIYNFLKERDYFLISKMVQSSSGAGNLIFMRNESKKDLI